MSQYHKFVRYIRTTNGKALFFLFALIIIIVIAGVLLSENSDRTSLNKEKKNVEYEITRDIPSLQQKYQKEDNNSSTRTTTKSDISDVSFIAPDNLNSQANIRMPDVNNGSYQNEREDQYQRNYPAYQRTANSSIMQGGSTKSQLIPTLTLMDNENIQKEETSYVSDTYAPYGTLIACKLVNTLESGNPGPILAVVVQNVWWTNTSGEKKLIIPAGTMVYTQQAGTVRNKIQTDGEFIFVWQTTTPDMTGAELRIKGAALDKLTDAGDNTQTAINDMSTGLTGRVIENNNLSQMLAYTLAFAQGVGQGFIQQSELVSNSSTSIVSPGTTQNAYAMGVVNLASLALQNVTEEIKQESYFVRVPAGTEFYIFAEQVIDQSEAKVANTNIYAEEKKEEVNPADIYKQKSQSIYDQLLKQQQNKK